MIGGLANFVLETATSPGTGAFILNGPETGRRPFSAAFRTGQTVFYFADDGSNAEWGLGTLTIGTPSTLARTTILGTTSGAMQALNFTGTVEVYNEIPAERIPILDESGDLTILNGNIVSDVFHGSTETGQLCWGGSVGGGILGRGTTGTSGPVGAYLYPIETVGSYVGGRLQVQGYGQRADVDFRLLSSGAAVMMFGSNQVAYTTDVTNAVAAEAKLRAGADTALSSAISSETSRAKSAEYTLQTNINSEASARASADTALSSAISAEVSRATTAESNLQSSKVNRNGDTMNGSLTVETHTGSDAQGGTRWGGQFNSAITGSAANGSLYLVEIIGSDFYYDLQLNYGSSRADFKFHQNGSIESSKGLVAFQSELPTDTVFTYNSYRAIKRVWPSGIIEQWFYTGDLQTINGQVTVLFPQAYASGVNPVVLGGMPTMSENGNTAAPNFSNEADAAPTITNTGFTVVNYGTNGSKKTCAFFVHVIG